MKQAPLSVVNATWIAFGYSRRLRRQKGQSSDQVSIPAMAASVRRNISFPVLPPFHHSACKRRQTTTDQSSIIPSSTAATLSPPPSAAFRSQRSQQNHPPANSLPRQIPIDGQVLTRCPAGSFFGGFRTPAFLPATARAGPASETLPDTGRSHNGSRAKQFDPKPPFASAVTCERSPARLRVR